MELRLRRLEATPRAGESVEAWARAERYRALREMAQQGGAELVLLAHHRRDQAETFLLQALRGGGVAALSAMPRLLRRDGVTWARPWLGQPRQAIEAYLRRHRLRWVEDDSNGDDRFARNRVREHVWPALVAAFADAEGALAAAAERVQHGAAAIDEIAALDLGAIADDRGVDIAAWGRLSEPRRRQALLRWLRATLVRSPPASLVERLMREALAAEAPRRWPAAGGELRSYRGRLSWSAATATARVDPAPMTLDLGRAGRYEVPAWGGAFRVERVAAGGLPVAAARRLELRARAAADRFQAGPRRPPRSLKLQFQANGVAAALRHAPVVCHGGVIVFVPGLGVDARAVAADGAAQVSLTWLPG